MPVWTVREAAACGLTEAERAAIVGRSRRFGLSGRAGISSKCEIGKETGGIFLLYFAEPDQILGYFAAGLEYWDTVKDFPVRYGAVIILQCSELLGPSLLGENSSCCSTWYGART